MIIYHKIYQVTCSTIQEMLVCVLLSVLLWTGRGDGLVPPKEPPTELLDQFTMDGQIPIEYYYVDDSNKGKGTHYKYSFQDINEMIAQAQQFVDKVFSMAIPSPPSRPSSTWLTQLTDIWLIHTLQQYSVAGLNVAVFGSTSPWYECILLAMGALSVTTIEYNRLTYDHPNITTTLVGEPLTTHFDRALSLSSFDHDGLGRYGDPINPDGDLVAMETAKQVLALDGFLFLTVPIGPDLVVWNLHRRYGNQRLPRLLAEWEQLECIGWDTQLSEKNAPYTLVYEPVFVLTPKH